jgi:hypothetical protein
MNTTQNPLRTLLLIVLLVFALVSVAGAGAVFKRGDRDKKGDRPTVSRPSAPREVDRSNSYRSSEPARPSVPSGPATRDRRAPDSDAPGPIVRDRRVPDATPTYRRQDSGSYRAQDRGNYDYRSSRPDRNDSKFNRVGERATYDHRATYRPPRYSGGHYFYGTGWPFYYDFACAYGNWVFEYIPDWSVRSVYFYYGYFPYVPSARVIIVHRPVVAVIEVPLVIRHSSRDDNYYLESPRASSIDRALSDIRSAWRSKDPDLLLRHVRSDTQIDVLLQGKYSYSLSGSDYEDMTRDAMKSMDTVSLNFYSVDTRGDDQVIAYGRHEFYDPDGVRKTIYVSYLLERQGGEWVIIQVGSSPKRLGS